MIINIHNDYVTLSQESNSFFKKRQGTILRSKMKIEKAVEYFYGDGSEDKEDALVILHVSKHFSIKVIGGMELPYILVFDGGVVFFRLKDEYHIIDLEFYKGKIVNAST